MKRLALTFVLAAALASADGPWLPPNPQNNAPGCACYLLYDAWQTAGLIYQTFPLLFVLGWF